MKTRILQTKIWKDGYYRSLNSNEKLLFVYFLSNEYVNQIWLYECHNDVIAFDTGIPLKDVENLKAKFQNDKKIAFYKDYVYLVNASKYENYRGDLNDKAREKILSVLPNDVLDWYKAILDRGIDGVSIGVYIPTINNKQETINNKEGGVGETELSVIETQKELKRPDKLTDHTVSHYVIELFRDINPDVARLHKLKTEAEASLTLYRNAVKGNLDQLERAIQAIPDIAADPYCPKEIKSISKPSQLLTHWALYCAQARGKRDAITNSGPLIL